MVVKCIKVCSSNEKQKGVDLGDRGSEERGESVYREEIVTKIYEN